MNHVLQAAFGANRLIKTAPLYQWDFGQTIRFVGLNLPSHFEAHFSNNQTSGTAITVIGENNEAAIPDSLLQTGLEIWAWVYLHDDVTDGETEYTARIPVKARARRDGAEPTPEQADAIATAIEALNEATEVLEDAITQTEEYRDQSEAYAIQSESWAIGGTDTRQGEDTDNAKYYRDQAEATAQRVTEAVDDFVDTTVPQAIQSVEDEGTAQIALVDAEGTAQIGAVGDAGTAQIALVGAEGTRQVGIVSGEGATQKGNVSAEGSAQVGNVRAEGNAQIGLVQSEGASQIANVSSAGSTQVGNVNSAGATQVSAVQSAGATQVGLVQAEGATQVDAVGDAGDAQIELIEDKGTEQIGLVEAEGDAQIAAIEAKGEEVLSEMIDKAPIITDTASGAIASFPDGADAPIKQLTVGIEPVQDLHGYDAPWPAGGGKNKYLPDIIDRTINNSTIEATGDGSVVVTGTPSSAFNLGIGACSLKAGTYILNGCPSGGGSTKYRLQVTNNSGSANYGQDNGSGVTFTLEQDETVQIKIQMYTGAPASVTFWPMVRLSTETDGTWAPYSNICPITGWTGANVVVSPTLDAQDGQTYPITWQTEAGTVYGGTLTVEQDGTGTLSAEWARVDLGTLTWSAVSTTQEVIKMYRTAKIDNMPDQTGGRLSGFICDSYPHTVIATSVANIDPFSMMRHSGRMYCRNDLYDNATDFAASMNGVYLVYELATPVTYTLTAAEMTTLLGTNNWWADCGDIENIEYRADTKLYIDKKLAALLAALS